MTDDADESIVRGYVKALTTIGVTACLPTAKEGAFASINFSQTKWTPLTTKRVVMCKVRFLEFEINIQDRVQ